MYPGFVAFLLFSEMFHFFAPFYFVSVKVTGGASHWRTTRYGTCSVFAVSFGCILVLNIRFISYWYACSVSSEGTFCIATVYLTYRCRNRHYSYICFDIPNPHRAFFLLGGHRGDTESPCVPPIPLVGYWVLGPEVECLILLGLWHFRVTPNQRNRYT